MMIEMICRVEHGQLVNHNFKVKHPNATNNWYDSNGDITEIMLGYCHLISRINYQLLMVWKKQRMDKNIVEEIKETDARKEKKRNGKKQKKDFSHKM